MAITNTHGSLNVYINQQSAMTPDSVKAIYTGDTLSISAINSKQNSTLSIFTLELVRDIQAKTFILGTHTDFQRAIVQLSAFPIILKTLQATVTLTTANHTSQTYSGSFVISTMSIFGPTQFHDFHGDFSLKGADNMF